MRKKSDSETREKSHQVTFKLEESYLLKLEKLAAQEGWSLHQQAAHMLRRVLDGAEVENKALRIEMAEIRDSIETLGRELKTNPRGAREDNNQVLNAVKDLLLKSQSDIQAVKQAADDSSEKLSAHQEQFEQFRKVAVDALSYLVKNAGS